MRRTRIALLLAGALAACGSDPGASYERGVAAFENRQPRTARIELMNVVRAEPDNGEARLMLARVHLALGDGMAAESELARARQLGIPAARTHHLMAEARHLQGDGQAALNEAAAAPPEHAAEAARVRAKVMMAAGNVDAARGELEAARAAAPRNAGLWTELARLHRMQGDTAGAIAATDRALRLDPREVEALVMRAELTRRQYGLQAALPWFDRALEIDPGHVPALLERAITYGDLGRMRDMLTDTRQVLSLTSGHPLAYYLQAMLAARARDYDLARALYARTGGAFDATPAGMLLLSAIDYHAGNYALAADRLSRLVDMQPGNRKARRLLAAARWGQDDPRGTIEALRPIADLADADSYSLSLIGRAFAKAGDAQAAAHYLARAAQPQHARAAIAALPDEAFAEVRQAALANPGDAPAQLRYISALLGRGLGAEALARAEQLRAANPGAPEAHMLVGDALGIQGDFAAAAEHYRRAANLAFTEPVALRLIEALRRSGQGAAADNVLRLFVQQNPRSVPGQVLFAARLMELGDWAGAIQVYESLRSRIGSRDATILNNLAWAYSENGELERALPLARRAWELDRDNPATTDTYGWLLFKSGRRGEGLALLQRAARGAPDDADIRRRLEQARRG